MASKAKRKKRPTQTNRAFARQRKPELLEDGTVRKVPTPERITGHETRREGMATRIVPTIDTLKNRNRITEAEWKALGHYAEQKCIAEQSPLRDSIGRLLHIAGSGDRNLPPAVVSAMQRVRWLEGELGSLREIAEAIAVKEWTITEWVYRNGGGRLKCETVDGVKVCKPYADVEPYRLALQDLRMAARRLMSAIAV